MAVLPMRLNPDGLNDLVILRAGSSAPAVVLSMPMATFTVTNTADRGAGSLRQVILDANANPGADLIVFNITPAGAKTISPPSKLPTITSPVTIDGTTQPGFSGSPIIELNGADAGWGANGLLITATSSVVRGLVINRFGFDGIRVEVNGGNLIEGNFIGIDVTGTVELGNHLHGVRIIGAPNNTIGGTAAGAGNIISGNNDDGVEIQGGAASGNQVLGNFIGTDVTGTADLGNSGNGILIEGAPNNTIGGTAAGAGNLIALNGQSGVFVTGTPTTGNAIRRNSIHSNGGLGIDLEPAGVTPNDACDGDSGPNRLQNFPLLLSASSTGRTTTIAGTLNGIANRTFILEFFATAPCDPSGHGQGQTFLGSATVTTDGTCNASFTVTVPIALTRAQNVTATATDTTTNDTSEFSACVGVTVPPNQPPYAVDDTVWTLQRLQENREQVGCRSAFAWERHHCGSSKGGLS